MGYQPIPPRPRRSQPSRLDAATASYVNGEIDVDEFEWRVAVLLSYGRAEETWAPLYPPLREQGVELEELEGL